jgi:hypothetical protein
MASKRPRLRTLVPLYINGISTNDIYNIRLEEDMAIVKYYDHNEAIFKVINVTKKDPLYKKFETYVFRYNSAFHLAML